MNRKISVWVLALLMVVICLPLSGYARTSDKSAAKSLLGERSVEVSQRRGNRSYQRTQNRRIRRNRRAIRRYNRAVRRHRRMRLVRRTYYRNGRRYTRTYRIYY